MALAIINCAWVMSFHFIIRSVAATFCKDQEADYPCLCGQRVQYLCVYLCVNTKFKSKQTTSHKLGYLRQKVVLYKTGKHLQVSMAQV